MTSSIASRYLLLFDHCYSIVLWLYLMISLEASVFQILWCDLFDTIDVIPAKALFISNLILLGIGFVFYCLYFFRVYLVMVLFPVVLWKQQ